MEVLLESSAPDDAGLVHALWPDYVLELAPFTGQGLNAHGVPSDDPEHRTPEDLALANGVWWLEPGALFPYLVRVDGAPAGFSMVAARARLPEGIDADFVVHEFYVVPAVRGTGAAEQAAHATLARHHGSWEVVTQPDHARAVAFWRRTLGRADVDDLHEEERDHPWGRRVVFRFRSGS